MSNDALVGRETANLLGGNVADDPHNFRVTVIDSVAGHVRKQGFVATFGSQKWPRKCCKYLLKAKSEKSQQRLIAANKTLMRSAA